MAIKRHGNQRKLVGLVSTTALLTLAVTSFVSTGPVSAQVGVDGTDGVGAVGGTGGAAGDGNPSGQGGDGGAGGVNGNGGAPPGAPGGSGGGPGGPGTPGLPLTFFYPNDDRSIGGGGGYAANGAGGGGGGSGGVGAFLDDSNPIVNAPVSGGMGGAGGAGVGSVDAGGGSGGGGGSALIFRGAGTLTVNAALTGGNGGNAGAASGTPTGRLGNDGLGGIGLITRSPNATLIVNAAISGGVSGSVRDPARRQVGLYAFDGITITLNPGGSIHGGLFLELDTLATATSTINFTGPTSQIDGVISPRDYITLVLNPATSGTTVGNRIAGEGHLVLNNGGKLTLTDATLLFGGTFTVNAGILEIANGGAIEEGHTVVNGGSLWVNGSARTVAVNGGFLGGSGTVEATTIAAGGTLAPGNSVGTITVADSLTFAQGSTYRVEVSSTAADRTNVVAGLMGPGNADLSGGSVDVTLTGDATGGSFTILNAVGGLGNTTFKQVTDNSVFFDTSLAYDANNVVLTVAFQSGPIPGLNENQAAVAGAGQRFYVANGYLPAAFATVDAAGLSQLTGEVSTGAIGAGMDATSQFLGLIGDPDVAKSPGGDAGDPLGYSGPTSIKGSGKADRLSSLSALAALSGEDEDAASKAAAVLALSSSHAAETAFETRWKLWGAAYGGGEKVRGDAAGVGSADLSSSSWGLASGITRTFDGGRVGIAMGGAGTSFSLANGLGSGNSTSFNAGVYGTGYFGDGYLSAALAYGYHATRTSRAVPGDVLSGSYGAQTFGGRLEVGHRVAIGGMALTPYAAVEAAAYRLPSYTETSALGGPFALTYASQTETSVRTELGARTGFDLGTNVKLTGRAAWVWNAANARSITTAFQTLPGTTFTVNGAQPARHAALLEAGVEAGFGSNVITKLNLTGEFSSNVTSFGAQAKVGIRW